MPEHMTTKNRPWLLSETTLKMFRRVPMRTAVLPPKAVAQDASAKPARAKPAVVKSKKPAVKSKKKS